MRSASLLVALFGIVVGVAALVSPDGMTAVRRLYFATPVGLYAAGVLPQGLWCSCVRQPLVRQRLYACWEP